MYTGYTSAFLLSFFILGKIIAGFVFEHLIMVLDKTLQCADRWLGTQISASKIQIAIDRGFQNVRLTVWRKPFYLHTICL